MPKVGSRFAVPVLLTTLCSALLAVPAEARTRSIPSQGAVGLPFDPGAYGTLVDPKGRTIKYGTMIDPNGEPSKNGLPADPKNCKQPMKNGSQPDPNGGLCLDKYGTMVDPDGVYLNGSGTQLDPNG